MLNIIRSIQASTRRLMMLAFLVAITPQLSIAAEHLSITGSSTVAPLALEIGKRFEKLNPGIRVDVQTGGSSRGINDARRGLADIGLVSRALKQSEIDLTAHTIATDGIGIILHSDNPVTHLSDDQIRAIYTGKIRNWRELGGEDRSITVVNKAEGRSTLELFLHYFGLRNSQIKARVIIGDNQQGIKTVAGNPGAIGYVSIGTAEYEEQRGITIKRPIVNGAEASIAKVRSGEFPLSRPLNLVTRGEPSEWAKRFILFAQSAEVDDLVEGQFFVSQQH